MKMSIGKSIQHIFWNGIKAVLPVVITAAIVVWLYKGIEGFFGGLIRGIFGSEYYFTGLGFLIGVVLTFIIGTFINALILRRISALGDRILKRIPLIKTVYTSITDLMAFFDKTKQSKMGRVVMVQLPWFRLVGLITRETFEDLPKGFASSEEVSVFIPLSCQIGGLTVVVPRSAIQPLDMPVEQAMKYIVTAGAKSSTE